MQLGLAVDCEVTLWDRRHVRDLKEEVRAGDINGSVISEELSESFGVDFTQ